MEEDLNIFSWLCYEDDHDGDGIEKGLNRRLNFLMTRQNVVSVNMKCMKQKAFGDQFLDTFINRHFDQPVMTCHTGFSRYKYDNTNTNTLQIQNKKATTQLQMKNEKPGTTT